MGWSKNHGRSAKVNADYAKQQGEYAQTEANKVAQFVEDNKTRWLPAVATVAARNSAYPNPENGDTVRVTSEAKTYRYVSPTGWVVTDIYDATAIDQVTKQLAQTKKQAASTVSHDKANNKWFAFVDDDGNPKIISIFEPIFRNAGVPLTCAVITDRINPTTNTSSLPHITLDDMARLRDELGWSMCNHTKTHPYLANLTESEADIEIGEAADYLNTRGFDGDIIVYPYGSQNATTRRVARRHAILGVGGYNSYNVLPIETYLVSRFGNISENQFDLDACKTIVDNAPVNSLTIFYTHVNYPMWEQTDSQQKLRDLISYIQADSNNRLGTLRDAVEQFGNIVDSSGDNIGKFLKISRDGRIVSSYHDLTLNVNSPVTDFPLGETRISLSFVEANNAGIPFGTSGTWTIYRQPYTTYSDREIFSYQEFLYLSTIRRRYWNTSTKTWGDWERVGKVVESETLTVRTTRNFLNANANISNYLNNAITVFYYDSVNSDSSIMPSPAGILETHRITNNGYQKQFLYAYNSNDIFIRTVKTDGTWNEWSRINTNVFTGTITLNHVTWTRVPQLMLTRFLHIEAVYGNSQVTITKPVYAISEISPDSANPTVIGSISGTNLQTYRDSEGRVFVKYSIAGQNVSTYFKVTAV